MPMPVPEERVYYQELRECGNVLLCWMPIQELERLVGESKVVREILEDHPHGVDVEVTPADFRYFKKRYGIDVGISPEDLLLAFEALMKSDEVHVEGEISGAAVEDLARRTIPARKAGTSGSRSRSTRRGSCSPRTTPSSIASTAVFAT